MEDHRQGPRTRAQAKKNLSLGDLYYDFKNPAALGSVKKLQQAAPKALKPLVKSWLRSQDLYTKTLPRRRHFPMNPYLAIRPNQTWEVDLMVMDSLYRWNAPYRYVLVCIDVFDKFCWAELMERKTAVAAAQAFSNILSRAAPRVCSTLRSDAGGEFLGKEFRKLLKQRGIRLQTAGGIVKASQVERLIRTLKNKLYKVMYFRGGWRYVDVLDAVVSAYNKTVHSSTNFAPADVGPEDVYDIWFRTYTRHVQGPPPKPKFKVGDHVRLLLNRGSVLNDRGFYAAYTDEIFRIHHIQTKHATGYLSRPLYHLTDLRGEPIKTGCYEEELALVNATSKKRLEKVFGSKGEGEYEVKFHGERGRRVISEELLRNLL